MKRLLQLALIFFISFSSIAQEKKDNKHEKIKALKIAFISQRLDLTEKEAQKFWPVYNLHNENINEIRQKQLRKIHYEIRQNKDNMSENEASDVLNRLTTAENNIHNEQVQLISKLKAIISSKKIILLKVAEQEFKRKILYQYKKRHHEGGKRN